MALPCISLAAITVILGLCSTPLFDLASAASEQLTNPETYIKAVLTDIKP